MNTSLLRNSQAAVPKETPSQNSLLRQMVRPPAVVGEAPGMQRASHQLRQTPLV